MAQSYKMGKAAKDKVVAEDDAKAGAAGSDIMDIIAKAKIQSTSLHVVKQIIEETILENGA